VVTPITRSPTVTTTRGVTTTRTTTPTGAAATATTPRTSTATTTTTTSASAGGTIIDALEADGRFTALVQALQATGLDSVLSGPGPYTLFAPTDAAFDALPAGAFEQLLDDPSGQLTDILRYHVIAGETMSADISNNMTATTVQGKPVRFEGQGTSWKINGANMLGNDIESSNGVVHVIDAVILPPPE
jgi:transforming growth factor-beta-induced protein